jgi:hypothetical protein
LAEGLCEGVAGDVLAGLRLGGTGEAEWRSVPGVAVLPALRGDGAAIAR